MTHRRIRYPIVAEQPITFKQLADISAQLPKPLDLSASAGHLGRLPPAGRADLRLRRGDGASAEVGAGLAAGQRRGELGGATATLASGAWLPLLSW